MPTKIRQTGYNAGFSGTNLIPTMGKKAVMETTAGTAVVVIADPNYASTLAGWGDQTAVSKIYIYESNVAHTTWTLRATFNLAAVLAPTIAFSCDIFSNNDIGIVYKSTNGDIKYRKITYATWTSAAEEIVRVNAGGFTYHTADIVITDGGIPVVAVMKGSTGDTSFSIHTRRTSDSTWQQTSSTQIYAGIPLAIHCCISITAVKGAGSSTNRPIAVGTSSSSGVGTDHGAQCFVLSLREDTAALVSAVVGQGSPALVGACEQTPSSGSVSNRTVLVACQANGQYTWAAATSHIPNTASGGSGIVGRNSWNGAGHATLAARVSQAFVTAPVNSSYGVAITPGTSSLNVTFSEASTIFGVGQSTYRIIDYPVLIDPTTHNITWATSQSYWSNGESASDEIRPLGCSDKNLSDKHNMVFLKRIASNSIDMWHEWNADMRAPDSVEPVNAATVVTSIPTIKLNADLDRKYGRAPITPVWQFATDAGFTTNVKFHETPVYTAVNGTDAAGVVKAFYGQLLLSGALAQGVWYIRGAQKDMLGRTSPYTSTIQSFTVTHPPTSVPFSPVGDQFFLYGAGNVSFQWGYSDTYVYDHQTAFQVIVERVDTGASVLDSGKILQLDVNTYVGAIPAGVKDIQLRWKVRTWDLDNVAGPYSSYATFYVGDPCTTVFTSPLNAAVVTTAVPTITANITVPAPRTLKSFRVTVRQGAVIVHDSGVILAAPGLSGVVPVSYTPSSPIMVNNSSYTITISGIDSANLDGTESSVVITTAWVLPATIVLVTASAALFGVEGAGYNSVSWPDTLRDADFQNWTIYRRVSQINPDTQVVFEVGDWEVVTVYYQVNAGGSYTIRDYYCGSNVKVEYALTQTVNRFGDLVEGLKSASATVFPSSDGYWLISVIDPSVSGYAIRLANVTGETLEDEYDQQELVLFDRGRYTDRGQYLGVRGSLNAQLRGSGAKSAREQRREVVKTKEDNLTMYLRNPFGDVYYISTSNISIGRVAGVGKSEFVDLTVPYFEVGK